MEKEKIIKTLKDTLNRIKEERNKTQTNSSGWESIISIYEKAIIDAENNIYFSISDATRIYLEFNSDYTSNIFKIMEFADKEVENYFNSLDNYNECFICNTRFTIDSSMIPQNQKTFYWKCPNCNAELKIGNPNYIENSENEKQEDVTDRDELIKIMELPSNIRKLSEEEKNKIICETIISVSKLLKEVKCDSSEYQLSQRQQKTKDNAINNIKTKNFLEAYYEITDFVDDYGDRHNGKIFETEKQEINTLLAIIYNNMQQ
ncbi:MAG: hypothetical protein IJV31_08485 [Clostridia bacterium]|nr:hypothetical protein [Clostridia bacterium]